MNLIKHLFGSSLLMILAAGTAFADELSHQNPLSFAQSCQALLTELSPQVQIVLNSIVQNIESAQLNTSLEAGGGDSAPTNFQTPSLTSVIAADATNNSFGKSAVALLGWNAGQATLALQFSSSASSSTTIGTCGPLSNAIWQAQAKVVPLVSASGDTSGAQDNYWYFSAGSSGNPDYTLSATDARYTFGRGYNTPVAFDYGFIAPLSPFANIPIQLNLFAPSDAPWFANAITISITGSFSNNLLSYTSMQNSSSNPFLDINGNTITWNTILR